MSIVTTRAQRRQLERDNAKRPQLLVELPRSEWPMAPAGNRRLLRVLRSRGFLVQEYAEEAPDVLVRLSVPRTTLDGERWADGISWDELQSLKTQCGYSDRDAVEVYPKDCDVVNVANIRHLWVMAEPLGFAWRKQR